jgi:hypothetical protein
METTWIVLANDCRLRVFEIRGSGGILHEIVDFLSPEGRMCVEKDFGTIRNNSFTRSHSKCAGNNKADSCNALARQGDLFSKQISSYIERARQNGRFEKMRIIGSGGFLKLLHENMPEKVKCLIEKEFVDDSISFEQPFFEKYLK